MTALLAVERLTVRFGGVTAVDDVTFAIEAGQRVAMTGPNGSGKTSVLDGVIGVVRPSGGRIVWRGRDLAGVGPAARAALGLSRTLQGLGVVDNLDVAANLLLGRHHRMGWRWGRGQARSHRARCEEVAAELDLDGGAAAGDLGAGARKRLELGRALAMDGDLLLLDEPFAGAAAGEVDVMVAAIRRASVERGAAALVVDHDLDTVLGLCDRVVELDAGRLTRA